MRSLIIIVAGIALSWHFIDVDAPSALYRVVMPALLVAFFIALALWLVLKAGFGRRMSRRSWYSTHFDDSDGG